ncbi:hypothetical protein [Sphingomonas sp. BK069]|uniref:hypothetical protein n=1 Tax=Sphingomonas sp. BK069 TaxID=2586979 RepID=UPI001614A12A|nr:hypothetical protein [Sphingomonas sp. BK069]MBB3346017.1 hypothetical protein [Sphingomonas sp. BK069]
MDAAYDSALRRIADSYEAEAVRWGGRSLSRVSTIVLNNGTFFERLRHGRTFTVANLERIAAWLRDPSNWPGGVIPDPAVLALISIGRPPLTHTPVSWRLPLPAVAYHREHTSQEMRQQ